MRKGNRPHWKGFVSRLSKNLVPNSEVQRVFEVEISSRSLFSSSSITSSCFGHQQTRRHPSVSSGFFQAGWSSWRLLCVCFVISWRDLLATVAMVRIGATGDRQHIHQNMLRSAFSLSASFASWWRVEKGPTHPVTARALDAQVGEVNIQWSQSRSQ